MNMKKMLFILLAALGLSLQHLDANDVLFNNLKTVSLESPIKLNNFELAQPGDNRKLELPKAPVRNDAIPVLRFRMVSYMPKSCGCNYSVVINVNGTDLKAVTANNQSRMIGKQPFFEMKSIYKGRKFPYWGRKNAEICIPYGPDCDTVDKDSVDGSATCFILDLSDVLSDENGNIVNFRNIRNHIAGVPLKVTVVDCEFGYLSKEKLQSAANGQENK